MTDITVAGLNVRYKVYPEKKKKPKIKYCVGFDKSNPTPEREWEQFRSDKDPDAQQCGKDGRSWRRSRRRPADHVTAYRIT